MRIVIFQSGPEINFKPDYHNSLFESHSNKEELNILIVMNKKILHVISFVKVHLFLIFSASCLTIRTMPIKKNNQGNNEKSIWYDNWSNDRIQCFIKIVPENIKIMLFQIKGWGEKFASCFRMVFNRNVISKNLRLHYNPWIKFAVITRKVFSFDVQFFVFLCKQRTRDVWRVTTS